MERSDYRRRLIPFLTVAPAYLWEFYFLFLPLLVIAGSSLAPYTGIFSLLKNYFELCTPLFARIVLNSIVLSVSTAVITLICAYPIAYYIAMKSKRFKNLLLVFLILPSWTSFIIQIYSWFFVLQRGGVLSWVLERLGWIAGPMSFLNGPGATLLGMVYCYLPFMIFPLYTVLERMDKRLIEASADLGAHPLETFRRIVLPLSYSGIKVGLFLVMVPAFGEFAIPDLMGGFKQVYVGRVIMEKFLLYRDWNAGSAVVMVTIIFPLLVLLSMALAVQFWERVLRRKKQKRRERKKEHMSRTDQVINAWKRGDQ